MLTSVERYVVLSTCVAMADGCTVLSDIEREFVSVLPMILDGGFGIVHDTLNDPRLILPVLRFSPLLPLLCEFLR